jgi:hypothetical protein
MFACCSWNVMRLRTHLWMFWFEQNLQVSCCNWKHGSLEFWIRSFAFLTWKGVTSCLLTCTCTGCQKTWDTFNLASFLIFLNLAIYPNHKYLYFWIVHNYLLTNILDFENSTFHWKNRWFWTKVLDWKCPCWCSMHRSILVALQYITSCRVVTCTKNSGWIKSFLQVSIASFLCLVTLSWLFTTANIPQFLFSVLWALSVYPVMLCCTHLVIICHYVAESWESLLNQ